MTTTATTEAAPLTPRWTPMWPHPEQQRLVNSPARFKVVVAGGRSGKTELMKREGVVAAMMNPLTDGRVIFAAPTRDQAKEIYWEDLKALVPQTFMARDPRETELNIKLIHGPEIRVVGMDKPQRIEGKPIDWVCLDEYRDMKKEAWESRVSPMLSTRGRPPGQARLIGRPGPRNHYYRLFKSALTGDDPEWDAFHWASEDILTAEEIASAKRRMDKQSYRREYGGEFIDYEGRAYYAFKDTIHAREQLKYDPRLPLIFCFDFNVSPGVAVVIQEQAYKGDNPRVNDVVTAVIGEVWIPEFSKTPIVCNKLIHDWKHHEGEVYLYGDATGGAKGTAKTDGSDWDIIKSHLRPVFGGRMINEVPRSNPRERVRLNAVNARLESADGMVSMLVDPIRASHVVDDLEGVVLHPGGSGEILKKPGDILTHISDALGYYIVKRHPIHEDAYSIEQF